MYDYLVIESTGIAVPMPIAQTFATRAEDVCGDESHNHGADGAEGAMSVDGEGHDHPDFEGLSKYARLDTLVTVVDIFNVLHVLGGVETFADRRRFLGTKDAQPRLGQEGEVMEVVAKEGAGAVNISGSGAANAQAGIESANPEDEEPPALCSILLDQIECANVICKNG